jgi:putative peptidoglycan lipid II flippase
MWGLQGLGKSFTLAGWTLLYVFISQVGYLVTVNVATSAAVRSAKDGITTGVGVTPFSNAYLIMLLPYSIVTISIVTAMLPHLSRLAIDKKVDEVREQLVRAIRMVGVVTVPSAVALLLFGPLITEVLFFGIGSDDSRYIGYVLSALSFGLVAFSINLILIRGFNAFEDTRTQVGSILVINLISIALSYLFLFTLQNKWITVGLGAAFSISYLVGLFVTLSLLKRHIGKLAIREFAPQHIRLFIASFIAMGPLFLISYYFDWVGADTSSAMRALELLAVMVISFIGFFFTSRLLRIEEISLGKELVTSLLGRNKSVE